jgi:hypothetical protein
VIFQLNLIPEKLFYNQAHITIFLDIAKALCFFALIFKQFCQRNILGFTKHLKTCVLIILTTSVLIFLWKLLQWSLRSSVVRFFSWHKGQVKVDLFGLSLTIIIIGTKKISHFHYVHFNIKLCIYLCKHEYIYVNISIIFQNCNFTLYLWRLSVCLKLDTPLFEDNFFYKW